MTFSAVDVITAKRDGGRLSDEQIDWVVAAYTRGDVADEQMSALAMAILLNGMDTAEIARWTQAMIDSGEVLSFGDLGRPLVDKHSTGGVGDKITLPLAPLVAACGAAVPQLSGRGLGHTGGTLDKLESIPGWRASLSLEEIARPARRRRRRDLRDHPDARPGRPQALRAARRHRHRRVDPADRQLDHEQEDRRGDGRAGARRQGRVGRVHEDRRAAPGSSPTTMVADRQRARPARRRRCSPTCPCRWAAPSATRWRSPSRSRCCAAAGPPTSSS